MKVHVILTNRFDAEKVEEVGLKKSVCAVIDTIRATSTIVTIIGCGGGKVIVAGSKNEALTLKELFKDSVLCGEEGGLPPRGFDFGNSPLELSSMDLKDRTFILMTTNGTQSILKAANCLKVYALSILNLYSCLDSIIENALEATCDILFLCSGEKGKIAYDDAYTAGLAVKYLLTRPYSFEFTDAAKLVLAASLCEFDIEDALEKSCSARSLRSVGLGEDIAYIARMNRFTVAPMLYKEPINKYLALKSRKISKKEVHDLKTGNTIFILK